MIQLYRRRANVVEAGCWQGNNLAELLRWANRSRRVLSTGFNNNLILSTLEGNRLVRVGHWILRTKDNNFCVCSPDLFQQYYEKVDFDEEVFNKIEKKKKEIARLWDEIYK